MRHGCSALRAWMGGGVFVAVVALLALPAGATGAQPGPVRGGQVVVGPGNTVIVQAQAPNHVPQRTYQHVQGHQSIGPCYPFGCDYRGPSYPFGNHFAKAPVQAAPTYAMPNQGGRRWVAPHWGQQWVPQYYVYQVWVPSYYSSAGWIQGYYEDRTAESGGYYQQVWVDGYWEE